MPLGWLILPPQWPINILVPWVLKKRPALNANYRLSGWHFEHLATGFPQCAREATSVGGTRGSFLLSRMSRFNYHLRNCSINLDSCEKNHKSRKCGEWSHDTFGGFLRWVTFWRNFRRVLWFLGIS